jgi:hypothetical protein
MTGLKIRRINRKSRREMPQRTFTTLLADMSVDGSAATFESCEPSTPRRKTWDTAGARALPHRQARVQNHGGKPASGG